MLIAIQVFTMHCFMFSEPFT